MIALARLSRMLIALLALAPCAAARAADGQDAIQGWVTFPGRDHALTGFLSRPPGNGPFRTVIYNHGSESKPGTKPDLAAFFAGHGFVYFIPHRSGHGRSSGVDISDKLAAHRGSGDFRAHQVWLLEEDNEDVVAAVAWLKTQNFVDPRHIAMAGFSYGGIQTLLAAEKGLGIGAFVSFAPAAMSWGNTLLRQRLLDAVAKAKAPLFLIQAANDFSTGPSEVLGPAVRAKGPPSRATLYPEFGASHRDGHGGFATRAAGVAIWGRDVLAFLHAAWGKN